MARRRGGSQGSSEGGRIHGARLEPIRTVKRELTRPDGTKLEVEVPVYPPFRLEERPIAKEKPGPRKREPDRKKKAS